MKLGLFDSGLGGGVVLESFKKYFPEMDIIIEMDREHAPYGDRDPEEIRALTRIGVQKLYDQGADVVILACNTASVHALRWLQQEIFPDRHILGVTIPGAERVVESGYKKIGVLATAATVKTRGYRERVHILDNTVDITEVACAGLVPLIEMGITNGDAIESFLVGYLSHIPRDVDAIVLGCTHYPLIRESLEKIWQRLRHSPLPDLIDPGEESAKKFGIWMERHRMN